MTSTKASNAVDMMPLKTNGASQCFHSSISLDPNSSRFRPSLNQISFLRRKKIRFQVLCSQKKDIPIVEARSMDEIYDTMAERLVPTAASGTNTSLTRLVGLAGPPGAGKTTIAAEVAKRVNKLWPQKSRGFDSQVEPPQIAVVLPMDGFHLYLLSYSMVSISS